MNHDQDIPRRCCLDQFVPAERAIYAAAQAVEAMPADVRLTDAVVLLGRARALVADYVDAVPAAPRVEPPPRPAWQPIETAPKDGTRLLLARQQLLSGELVVVSGSWNSGGAMHMP